MPRTDSLGPPSIKRQLTPWPEKESLSRSRLALDTDDDADSTRGPLQKGDDGDGHRQHLESFLRGSLSFVQRSGSFTEEPTSPLAAASGRHAAGPLVFRSTSFFNSLSSDTDPPAEKTRCALAALTPALDELIAGARGEGFAELAAWLHLRRAAHRLQVVFGPPVLAETISRFRGLARDFKMASTMCLMHARNLDIDHICSADASYRMQVMKVPAIVEHALKCVHRHQMPPPTSTDADSDGESSATSGDEPPASVRRRPPKENFMLMRREMSTVAIRG